MLADLGVGEALVTGSADGCVRSGGPYAHGLPQGGGLRRQTLVSNTHTTEDQTSWGAPPPDQVIARAATCALAVPAHPHRRRTVVPAQEVKLGAS